MDLCALETATHEEYIASLEIAKEHCEFHCVCFQSPTKAVRMRERFASLGLELQIYAGVPHTDPRIAGHGLSPDLQRLWSVTYGHLDMIQRFYDGGKPFGLFGEDDVVVNRTLPLNLPYLIAEASQLGLDVVLLGYMKTYKVASWMAGYATYPGSESIAAGRPYTYHKYPADQWGVHLYMVSRAGARRILDEFSGKGRYADRYVNDPARPFSPDWTITKCPGIRRALVSPMFAVEDGGDDYEHYAHGGQYQFHRETYTFNYVPGLFV